MLTCRRRLCALDGNPECPSGLHDGGWGECFCWLFLHTQVCLPVSARLGEIEPFVHHSRLAPPSGTCVQSQLLHFSLGRAPPIPQRQGCGPQTPVSELHPPGRRQSHHSHHHGFGRGLLMSTAPWDCVPQTHHTCQGSGIASETALKRCTRYNETLLSSKLMKILKSGHIGSPQTLLVVLIPSWQNDPQVLKALK